jgi:TMEM175 potassium channel family protein
VKTKLLARARMPETGAEIAPDSERPVETPGVGRALALTDAVVAIAMTLLVLPLVEVSGEVDTNELDDFLADHWDLFLSFAISFVVIYVFWTAHGVAFRRIENVRTEARILPLLNLWWLLLIAFLPFPTAVVGRDLNTTSAPLYIGTMTVLSALTSGIVTAIDHMVGPSPRTGWAWLTTGVFALCTLLSAANADLGMLALLSLAVVRAIEARALAKRSSGRARSSQ